MTILAIIYFGIAATTMLLYCIWKALRAARENSTESTLPPVQFVTQPPLAQRSWYPPESAFPARTNVKCTRCGCERGGTFCTNCGLRLLHHSGGRMMAADYTPEERRKDRDAATEPEWIEVGDTVSVRAGGAMEKTVRYIAKGS